MRRLLLANDDSTTAPSCSERNRGEFLIQYNLSLGEVDEAGNTPLHWAAFSGNTVAFEQLIPVSSLDATNRKEMHPDIHEFGLIGGAGVTALMLASERGFD